MRIEWSDEFDDFLSHAEARDAEGDPTRLVLLAAMLDALRELEQEPEDETAAFKLVREARRHRLWRVAHPFREDAAVRIICWFPEPDVVVVALVAFDKAVHGDVFYTSAAIRAEALADQWLRERNSGAS